ncbi:hypothetical protein E2320_003713, partial [Naja naja]
KTPSSSFRAASHLLQPIGEEEEDDRDESLAQPGIMSPFRNSTFLPSLFQSFCGSSWKQVRDPHASLPCLHKKHRLGLLRLLKEEEGPMKPEAQREIEKEEGPSLWITLKILLFMSLVSLKWTLLEIYSPSNRKWRRGVESGSPEGSHTIRFFFICKDQSYSPVKDEHHSNNTFNVRTENVSSDQIICKCKFAFRKFMVTSWEQPYSPESNQLVFSVVGVPTSPMLKVDPLSQRVEEGDPLVFLCSTEGGTTEKKFHFYKDGVEIISSKGLLEPSTDHLQNASLRIRHASFNDRGEFACSYEEKRSNRWIMSSLSLGVNITVKPDSDPIWRYSWMVIPLIILLVPFAFYCWRKKSTSVSQEQFQLREKKEERNDLPVMEPQAATADSSSPVKLRPEFLHSVSSWTNKEELSNTKGRRGDIVQRYCVSTQKETAKSPLIAAKCISLGPALQKSKMFFYFKFSLGAREARRMGTESCCREEGFGVVKKARELGWAGGMTQFLPCPLNWRAENPEVKMEIIPWMTVLSSILLGAEESRAEFFMFYCKDRSDLTITNEGLNENTFNLRTADLNSDLIKCTCRFERVGGWLTSPQSKQMVFRVHGSWLPAPKLSSPLPDTVVIKGEEIPLKCSLPEKYWAESFIFYCKDQSDLIITYEVIYVTYENITKNTFKFRTADLNSDQMKIKCTCWFWYPHGGSPPSPQSNQLDFFINAPPSPGLRVDPLSQRVEEGDPLVFLCSTERGDREKKFHFYKDGLEIISCEEVLLEPSTEPTNPLQNASLRILHASFNHSGEFACSYEEKRSNRWIMSSWSRRTNITVEPGVAGRLNV